MHIKKITVILSQLLCISSFSQAVNSCEDKSFWQTWYKEGQFKGFGISPSKQEVAKAQYLFAENHYKGNFLTKDYTRALALFTKASEAGLSQADFRLGLMNHYGQGKVKDLQAAYKYYENAASANNPEAQFNLGLMNRYGIGIQKDLSKAFSWFTKSANNQTILDRNSCIKTVEGVVEAQFNLAQMNHYGLGTEKNV